MTTGLAALEPLVELLTPTELRRVAASLEATGRVRRAAREVAATREALAHRLLSELVPEFGAAHALAAALRVAARILERQPEPPTIIWSGPQLPGDSVRTTDAIERLIDEAEESVLASTYSGSGTAPFVQALRRAANRKVTIMVVADVVKQRDCAYAIASAVPRAKVYGYHYEHQSGAGYQHSKVLVIDGQISLVTSANLSAAALERHLEAGLLTRDISVASGIARRMTDLIQSGHLRPLPGSR
ncbi:DISARM system phospholipase D-like protein DrmC [Dactylosporangium cerinum]|uniref:DISARM system phospholipase D-like protein DrmC n=1 Tax=Dactylosporangium cerinum TaxID=1434730 RepID=A0ABV9VWP6_9ACTN